jgi:hypothetical protein
MRLASLTGFVLLFLVNSSLFAQSRHWRTDKGIVMFESNAPLELIKAQSKSLRGIINPDSNTFAFLIEIRSFKGFNSDVQQVHFLEDYLEWKKYPEASFAGKIIEKIPYDVPGTYPVRAKGNLTIHGITKERIIRGTLTVSKTGLHIKADFTILVDDHGITIPKIVQQKIADEVYVTVDLDFIADDKL